MQTSTSVALATLVALGSLCASAQTSPPGAGNDPAPARSGGASPQNPSVNGYKDSKPDSTGGGTTQRPQQNAAGAGASPSEPTGKDSMTKDNRPRHPAAGDTKTSDPK